MTQSPSVARKAKAVSVAIALVGSSSALAAEESSAQLVDPIRVGIIDTDATVVHQPKNGVTVSYASFIREGAVPGSHKTKSGREHGADVARAFIEQAEQIDPKSPIHIYSAGVFFRTGNKRDEDGNRPMEIDWSAANKALDWLRDNNVRVVITPFIARESLEVNEFMGKARELGMVVFAATQNVHTNVQPFPARHPDAISVTGSSRNLDFSTNEAMREWVMFQANASIPGKSLWMIPENGSSFAVGRAAAFGSFLVAKNPGIARDDIIETMRSVASVDRGVSNLSAGSVAVRFREALAEPSLRLAAKAEEPELQGQPHEPARLSQAARVGMMAALASGMGI